MGRKLKSCNTTKGGLWYRAGWAKIKYQFSSMLLNNYPDKWKPHNLNLWPHSVPKSSNVAFIAIGFFISFHLWIAIFIPSSLEGSSGHWTPATFRKHVEIRKINEGISWRETRYKSQQIMLKMKIAELQKSSRLFKWETK